MATKDQLIGKAVEIRDADQERENTALRVGSLLLELLNYFDQGVDMATLREVLNEYAKLNGYGITIWHQSRVVPLASMDADLDGVDGGEWTYTPATGDIYYNAARQQLRFLNTSGETEFWGCRVGVIYINLHTRRLYTWTSATGMQELSGDHVQRRVISSMVGADLNQQAVGTVVYYPGTRRLYYKYADRGWLQLPLDTNAIYCDASSDTTIRWDGTKWVSIGGGGGSAGQIAGYVGISSEDELPENPTAEQKTMCYVLGTTYYVWVTSKQGDHWAEADMRGPQGPQGPQGEQGPAGTIAIGSVSSGTSASVTNSGTASAAVLDFVLPKGAKGDKGDKGDTGASGVHVGDTVIEQTTGTSTTSLMSQKAVTDAIDELDKRMPTSISGSKIISYNVADYPLLNPALSDGITLIYDKRVTGSYIFYDLLSLESLDQRNYFRISVTGWQYKIVTKINGGSENTQTLNPGAAAISGEKVFIATTINFKTGEIKFYSDGVYMSTASFDTSKLPDFELVERVTMSSYGEKIRFLGVCSSMLTDEQMSDLYSNYPNDVFEDLLTSLKFGVNEIDLGTGSGVQNGVTFTFYGSYVDVVTTSASFSNCYVIGRRNYITSEDAKRDIIYRMHITVTEGTPHLNGIGINGRHKCTVYDSNGDVVSSAGDCDLPVGEYDLEFVGQVLSNNYVINFSKTGVCKFRISDVTVQYCGAALILSPYNLRGNKFVQPNGDEIEGTSSLNVFYDTYKPEIVFSGDVPAYNGQIKCEGGHVYFGYVTEGLNVWKRLDN